MLRALCSDYLLFAVSGLKTLLVVPLLLGWLGDEEYGLWMLVLACAGYLDIGTFGVSGPIIRRIAEVTGRAPRDAAAREAELRRVQASGSLLLLELGAFLAVASVALSWVLPSFLDEGVAPGLVVTARLILLVVAARIVLGVATNIFACILYARRRIHEIYGVQTVTTLLSLAGTLWVVAAREGLLWLAVVNLVSFLPEPLWFWWSTRRQFPEGRWGAGDVRRAEMRGMLNVGGWLMVATAVGIVQSRTLPWVIWYFGDFALAAVTVYSINQRLWHEGLILLRKIPSVVWPNVSQSLGASDAVRARRYLKAMALPSIALGAAGCAGFGFFARDFLDAWVGASIWEGWLLAGAFAVWTYLRIAHHFLHLALLSAGKTRAPALMMLGEFALMLVLIATVGLRWGVGGMVAAALAAYVLTTGWFSAWYFCRVFELSIVRQAARAAWMTAAGAVPALAAAWALRAATGPMGLVGTAALGSIASTVGLFVLIIATTTASQRASAWQSIRRRLARRAPSSDPSAASPAAVSSAAPAPDLLPAIDPETPASAG